MSRLTSVGIFVVGTCFTAYSLLASAQTKKPAVPSLATSKKQTSRPSPASAAGSATKSPAASLTPDAAEPVSPRTSGSTGGDGGPPRAPAAVATLADGGARVFRFGEVEVEGRLKSPQIVYFLRRVRAEFAADSLGHRSFVQELEETRNEPGF